MNYLTNDIKVTVVQAALADGATDPDSTALNMAGFDGVLFVGMPGTITGSGTCTMKAAQSSDNGSSDDFTDISGATVQASGSGDSGLLLLLDVANPGKQYVRTTLTRATANSVWNGTIAIQYNGHQGLNETAAAQLAAAVVQVRGAAESA